MKYKCVMCGTILEPTKENEIAQIEYLKRNKLPPAELCTQLTSTLGTCKDGGYHECTFESEDMKRMANIISDYDKEVSNKEKERQHNVVLVNKREELLNQLRKIGDDIRNSIEKISESESDIETVLTDYEAISNTKDIEFYRTVKIETKGKTDEVKEVK